ncbi:MAG: FAD:protein FMN transferase [bacterium]
MSFKQSTQHLPTQSRAMLLIILLLFVSACQRQAEVYKAEFYIFGTVINISLTGVDDAQAEHAFTKINTLFTQMHHNLHAWKPGKLVELNKAIHNGLCFEDKELARLITRAGELETRTNHLFNPAIGRVLELWGFHTDTYPIKTPPPSQASIQEIIKTQPSTTQLSINNNKICSTNPQIAIDFGGFAKGVAVDRAVHLLKQMHINNAIVNAGGDLITIGQKGQSPWVVAIQSPGDSQVIGTIESLDNEAIFTSGTYARFLDFDGQRYPHILDPRTGKSALGTISATVIATKGDLADAAATALIVAGKKEWLNVAEGLCLDKVLFIDSNKHIYLTPAMLKRVNFLKPTPPYTELKTPQFKDC